MNLDDRFFGHEDAIAFYKMQAAPIKSVILFLGQELRDMSEECKVSCPERSVYLGENLTRVRQVGFFLDSLGGFPLMSLVCEMVPPYDRGEINVAWDGIGRWLA